MRHPRRAPHAAREFRSRSTRLSSFSNPSSPSRTRLRRSMDTPCRLCPKRSHASSNACSVSIPCRRTPLELNFPTALFRCPTCPLCRSRNCLDLQRMRLRVHRLFVSRQSARRAASMKIRAASCPRRADSSATHIPSGRVWRSGKVRTVWQSTYSTSLTQYSE